MKYIAGCDGRIPKKYFNVEKDADRYADKKGLNGLTFKDNDLVIIKK